MSHQKNTGKSARPELKLNLSLRPRGEPSALTRTETDDDDGDDNVSASWMSTSSSSVQSLTSPPSSCVSSENSPEAPKSMVLAGCPRCLMYVMVSQGKEPKCPKCNNAVLLDFTHNSKSKSNAVGKY